MSLYRSHVPLRDEYIITDELGRVVAQLATADGNTAWRPDTALTTGLYFARTADGLQVAPLAYAGR